ncbi:MAG: hypothetical protein WBQ09_03320 [Terriglobales bacterium]
MAAQRVYAQAPGQTATTQPPAFEQKLREVRYDLRLENGKFAGAAAPVLEGAIANAQYVLIGEDHITREIPQFTAVVCDLMAPQGLSAMAVEIGPQVAELVSASFGKPDRLARTAALIHQYPNSIAFMDIRQENDLAAHCAEVAHNRHLHLWGLDQEFVGSAGWLLGQILAAHPGPAATAAITRLTGEEQQDAARAKEAGDPSKLFLFAAPDSELAEAAALLRREGNAVANTIFQELIVSREIYLKNAQGAADSNSQRAQLMKEDFRQDMEKSAGDGTQKVLFKFGDWHLYKGFNPLHQRDLGNYIAEMADGQGSSSLHICVLGAKGTHRLFAGYDQPTRLEKFVMDEDPDYLWLKPAIDNQIAEAWTLYDLRKLRFAKMGAVDPDMERMIYGYDLLVIVPELTPADVIQ